MERLQQHYEDKYRDEGPNPQGNIIGPTRYPADRYEACVKYFPRFFSGGRILELGCGSGVLGLSLAAGGLAFDSYVFLDIARPRLERLSAAIQDKRFNVVNFNVDTMEHPDSEQLFDAVIMIALIEHFIDPITALLRVHKLLKPGGFVYVDTPNMAKYSRRLKLLFGYFPGTATKEEGLRTYEGRPVALYDEGHLHYFTYRSLSRLLTDYCGFSRVVKLGYSCPVRINGPVESTLARIWPEMFSELVLVAYK